MDDLARSGTSAELPILWTGRVMLRQPVPGDVADRVEIPRDPEENRMYGGSGEPKVFTEAEVRERLAEYGRQDLTQGRAFVIAALVWPDGSPVDAPDGRHIGSVRLHDISWPDLKARFSIGIFDRRFRSHGYGSEAIRLLLGHTFEQMKLHRVELRVLEFNTRAIRAYEKCGFVREGLESTRQTARSAPAPGRRARPSGQDRAGRERRGCCPSGRFARVCPRRRLGEAEITRGRAGETASAGRGETRAVAPPSLSGAPVTR
jgi:[ribosomal protein S5]-alanine N-acetyltransferase